MLKELVYMRLQVGKSGARAKSRPPAQMKEEAGGACGARGKTATAAAGPGLTTERGRLKGGGRDKEDVVESGGRE